MSNLKAKQLLDFDFRPSAVFGIMNDGLEPTVLKKNLDKLDSVIEQYNSFKPQITLEQLKELIRRLHKAWVKKTNPSDVIISIVEVQNVGYGIEQDTEAGFMDFIHKVVEAHWNTACVKGFMTSLLMHWTKLDKKVRDISVKFIEKHAADAAKILGDSVNFIRDNGPVELAHHMLKQKLSIDSAPTIMHQPKVKISYLYFSDTIIQYYKYANTEQFEEIDKILNRHNQTRTDKILLPILILNNDFDKVLIRTTMRRIGDPFDESLWGEFEAATKEQNRDLKRAREKLLSWLLKDIIRVFFEVLCKDSERKNFWMNYTHLMRNFRVYGSKDNSDRLENNIKSPFVRKHYYSVSSNSDNFALVMYFDKYVIVEFTMVGALYVYELGGQNYLKAFKFANSLNSIDELKVSGMDTLVDAQILTSIKEGRLVHRGEWTRRMRYWMNRYVK